MQAVKITHCSSPPILQLSLHFYERLIYKPLLPKTTRAMDMVKEAPNIPQAKVTISGFLAVWYTWVVETKVST